MILNVKNYTFMLGSILVANVFGMSDKVSQFFADLVIV